MKFSNILQRATSATSNKQILQRVTNDFTTSNKWFYNEQRATSDPSREWFFKTSDFCKSLLANHNPAIFSVLQGLENLLSQIR